MKPLYTITFLFLSMLWIFTASANNPQVAFEQGDYAAAKKQLEAKLANSPNDTASLILLGKTQLQMNLVQEAAVNFEQAAILDEANPEAYYWIGRANGRLAGNASLFSAGSFAKKSKMGFEKAIALDPGYIPAHRGMIEYYLNAPRLFGGSTKKAYEVAQKMQQMQPLEGKLAYARVLDGDDQDDKAMELYRELTQQYPKDPRAFLALGFEEQNNRNFETAHEFFSKAARTKPKDVETGTARAMALYQIGKTAMLSKNNLQAGIASYEEYLSMPIYQGNPEPAWAHYRLSKLYEIAEQPSMAEKHLELARQTEDKDLLRML